MSHHVHARTYVVRAYVLPEAAGRGKIFLSPGFLPQKRAFSVAQRPFWLRNTWVSQKMILTGSFYSSKRPWLGRMML